LDRGIGMLAVRSGQNADRHVRTLLMPEIEHVFDLAQLRLDEMLKMAEIRTLRRVILGQVGQIEQNLLNASRIDRT